MKTRHKTSIDKLTTEVYYSEKQKLLRKIGTNIFFYSAFFLSGLILIIVAAVILNKGVNYDSGTQFSKADSYTVLQNASKSLFVVGALFVIFPIIINIYIITKIRKSEILSNSIPKVTTALLISGIIIQITAFIGMIKLYGEIKKIYIRSIDNPTPESVSSKPKSINN